MVVLFIIIAGVMWIPPRWSEFDQLDGNDDGFLVAEEYQGTEESFEEIDKDGDGRLSRWEYLDLADS